MTERMQRRKAAQPRAIKAEAKRLFQYLNAGRGTFIKA